MTEINKKEKKLSYSGAKELAKSIKDYEAYLTKDREQKEAFVVGRAFDSLFSNPDTWTESFAVMPDFGNPKTKAAKEAKQTWLEENEGVEGISKENYKLIQEMYDSVFYHPYASRLMEQSKNEYELDMNFEHNGVEAHGRVDLVNFSKKFVVDIKTTKDSSIDGCMKDIQNYKYYWQMWFYIKAYEAKTGEMPKKFLFMFVGKSYPHTVTLIELGKDWFNLAEKELFPVFEKFRRWKNDLNVYHGTHPEIHKVDSPPAWMMRKDPIVWYENSKKEVKKKEFPVKLKAPKKEVEEERCAEYTPEKPEPIKEEPKKPEATKKEKPVVKKESEKPKEDMSSPVFEFSRKVCTEDMEKKIVSTFNKIFPDAFKKTGDKYSISTQCQEFIIKHKLKAPNQLESKKESAQLFKYLDNYIKTDAEF